MNSTRGIAVNYYCFSNNNNLLFIFVDPKPMDWIWVAYYYYINNNNFFYFSAALLVGGQQEAAANNRNEVWFVKSN